LYGEISLNKLKNGVQSFIWWIFCCASVETWQDFQKETGRNF